MGSIKTVDKYDHFLLGVLAGLILPVIGFFIQFLVFKWGYGFTFDYFIETATSTPSKLSNVLTLCAITNMLGFYLVFFRWKLDRASRGLVFMTLMMGAIIVYLSI